MSVFDELRAHASLPFEQARMLPLEAYSSTEVLDAELATVFAQDWQCVARTADVEDVGDYVCADLPVTGGGVRPIVVIRGEDSIRAFDNVCIHRGAQLLTGCGNEVRITCPYHAWVYRHDGSLVGGPYMAESTEVDGSPFSPDRHRLPEVRVELWNGFVFVNLDPDAEALGLVDGQQVRLHNALGAVELPLRLSDRVRAGVLYVPKGAWIADSETGQTVNALIPGHRSDVAAGACYYDCSVDLSPAA